jgi:hypothetical protein
MDAACQDNQDLKAPAASQVNQANRELQAPQETQASRRRHLASQLLHHHANLAHKDRQDHQDPQEAQETQERPAPQDDLDLTLPQAALDLAARQDHKESQDQSDQMESRVFQHNQSL